MALRCFNLFINFVDKLVGLVGTKITLLFISIILPSSISNCKPIYFGDLNFII